MPGGRPRRLTEKTARLRNPVSAPGLWDRIETALQAEAEKTAVSSGGRPAGARLGWWLIPAAAVGVKKDAAIKTSFTAVDVRTVGGSLKVNGESSSVRAEDVGGAVDIRNSFKNVVLRNTAVPITIVGESSGVDIARIKAGPSGGRIDVKTSFRPILLAVPAGVGVSGTAQTEFGKIITDFPVLLRDASESGGRTVAFESEKPGLTIPLETADKITIKMDEK